jgi:hypothetical protein
MPHGAMPAAPCFPRYPKPHHPQALSTALTHPCLQLCKLVAVQSEVVVLKVNFEENKSVCKALGIKVCLCQTSGLQPLVEPPCHLKPAPSLPLHDMLYHACGLAPAPLRLDCSVCTACCATAGVTALCRCCLSSTSTREQKARWKPFRAPCPRFSGSRCAATATHSHCRSVCCCQYSSGHWFSVQ